MKGTSKVIMGATLVMVVILAVVLGLILVLIAELYCSLLLRRRQLRNTALTTTQTAVPTTVTTTRITSSSETLNPQDYRSSSSPSLSSFYAHGVLRAPRSFLFPSVPSQDDLVELKNRHSQLHQVIDIQNQDSNTDPHRIGVLSTSPNPNPDIPLHGLTLTSNVCPDKACADGEHFVYISNPIYDNDGSRPSGENNTPFETPDTSPSHLERNGSSSSSCYSSGENEVAKASASKQESPPITPPLTPMKKLPAEASSVSLRNTKSLGTSGSDYSNTNNGLSSSSSGSPCTSPSW